MRRPYTLALAGAVSFALGLLILGGCPGLPSGGGGGASFNLPPTVVLTSDVQRGVAPLTVMFSSSGSSDDDVIVARSWNFGDGVGTSSEISPTYTFTTTGDYVVRLTLTDSRGATSSRTTTINVTQRPVAVLKVDRTAAETAPATFNFDGSESFDPDAQAGDVLRYLWDFGDGSTEVIPVVAHTYAAAGSYRVRLTVTDRVGVTGYQDKIITVGIRNPTISFVAPPADVKNIVCSNATPLWVTASFDVEPTATYMLSAGLDRDKDPCDAKVAIYDPRNGSFLIELTGYGGPVRAAAFSPDGTRVVSGGDDGLVYVHDVDTGYVLATYSGPGVRVTAVAFAPDGESFAVGYINGNLVLRDADSNNIIRAFPGHTAAVNAVAFDVAGERLFSGDGAGVAILWNVADASELQRYEHNGNPVWDVAFSPTNAERVLTGSADDTARLWSTVNGSLALEFAPVFNNGVLVAGHSEDVTGVDFSGDGTLVLTSSDDNTAVIWEVATGAQVRRLTGHQRDLNTARFSPNDTLILTGSDGGTARVWDAETGEELRQLKPCTSPVFAAEFSEDGTMALVAVAAANSIQLDTNPPQGNDLTLMLPTALNLGGVEEGRYFLWAEINTTQTEPRRTYATAEVNVIGAYTQEINDDTPIAPLVSGEATILVPPTRTRQIVDLGQLDLGDRVHLSLATVPGYGHAFTQLELNPLSGVVTGVPDGFSLLMLDASASLFTWYNAGQVLFTPDSKLIIGHSSASYYLVLETTNLDLVPGAHVRIQRAFSDTTEPRQQYVHINFLGGSNLAFGGSVPFDIGAFNIAGRDNVAVQNAILARVDDLLGVYDFIISTDPPSDPARPRLTIYFDTDGDLVSSGVPDRNRNGVYDPGDLYFWGLPHFKDPRNETLSGRAVVAVDDLIDDPVFGAQADGQLGLTIGNIVVHQIGLLGGLRETYQPLAVDDIMTVTRSQAGNAALGFVLAPLAAIADLDGDGDVDANDHALQIGLQDGPQLLLELYGPAN